MKFFQWILYPLMIFQAHAQDSIILHHAYYTTFFVRHLKAPMLSHYYFTARNRVHVVKRSSFHDDPELPADEQATAKDFLHSGYDKGHLSPDDDFRFDAGGESDAMEYTNQAPQAPEFNRVTWRELENHVRQLGKQHDTVSVYTGCIFVEYGPLGSNVLSPIKLKNDVTIPAIYYKIIFYHDSSEAFLGNNSDTEKPYLIMKTTMQLIEQLTGFTFERGDVKYSGKEIIYSE
jgi:endonuclease G